MFLENQLLQDYVVINFLSFTPFVYKIYFIKTLLFREFKIRSNYILIDMEFNFIKGFLLKNGYSIKIVERYMKIFLKDRIMNEGLTYHPSK